MGKNRFIQVNGKAISIVSYNEKDYICLTDMTQKFEGGSKLIEKWLNNKSTIEFLGVWERLNNPSFNSPEFGGIYTETGSNKFYISISKFIKHTNAIGLVAKTGRYGGTYAHMDIAYHFGMWLSPEFNLLVIKEFQILKEKERKDLKSTEWLYHRFSAKANYTIQTDAIKQYIIPHTTLPKEKHGILYASEAELINVATLGYTSKQWAEVNPKLVLSGKNLRDYLPLEELIVLDNMQGFNSYLLSQELPQAERLPMLQREARRQLNALLQSKTIKKVGKNNELSTFDQSLKRALDYNPHNDDEKNEEKV